MAREFEIDLRSDLRSAVLRMEAGTTQAVEASAVRALNRTATSVRAAATRLIRQEYNLRAGAIRRQIRISRANRGRLVSQVIATGRRIPLVEFSARQTRRGVTVRVKKQRKLVRGVFIARMPTGHVGVFERQTPERLPIRELFSVSLPAAFTNRQVMAAMRRLARERFQIEFARDLKFRLGR